MDSAFWNQIAHDDVPLSFVCGAFVKTVDAFPGGKFLRQKTPLATRLDDIKHGVNHGSFRESAAFTIISTLKMVFNKIPLLIG